MRIDHIAIWTYNLEGMRNFYMHYFDASSSEIYYNHSREFRSYFLFFEGGSRIELMEMPKISKSRNDPAKQYTGFTHLAINTGSKSEVNRLTESLREDGFIILSDPHTTGDGYYESMILDPDNNRLEIISL